MLYIYDTQVDRCFLTDACILGGNDNRFDKGS